MSLRNKNVPLQANENPIGAGNENFKLFKCDGTNNDSHLLEVFPQCRELLNQPQLDSFSNFQQRFGKQI